MAQVGFFFGKMNLMAVILYMMIRVGQMFLFLMRISMIHIFLTHNVWISMETPLRVLVSNVNKICVVILCIGPLQMFNLFS